MIKPDGVSRQLVGKVRPTLPTTTTRKPAHPRSSPDSRSEDTSSLRESPFSVILSIHEGLRLTPSIKSLTPSPALAKEHYIDLASRPFYAGLVKYITSGTPVVAM